MTISMIHRADLVITSKETALEFYKGVKSCILIPCNRSYVIRVEPGNLFSVIPTEAIKDGSATFMANVCDEDGILAYRYRKYINAYLRKDD